MGVGLERRRSYPLGALLRDAVVVNTTVVSSVYPCLQHTPLHRKTKGRKGAIVLRGEPCWQKCKVACRRRRGSRCRVPERNQLRLCEGLQDKLVNPDKGVHREHGMLLNLRDLTVWCVQFEGRALVDFLW
jgi:hypothetical protein